MRSILIHLKGTLVIIVKMSGPPRVAKLAPTEFFIFVFLFWRPISIEKIVLEQSKLWFSRNVQDISPPSLSVWGVQSKILPWASPDLCMPLPPAPTERKGLVRIVAETTHDSPAQCLDSFSLIYGEHGYKGIPHREQLRLCQRMYWEWKGVGEENCES